MKITYFADTDTALLEFSSARVVSTREIARDVLVDLDARGKPVSITIEHARRAHPGRPASVSGRRVPRQARNQLKARPRAAT